jgi:hypothetical protein
MAVEEIIVVELVYSAASDFVPFEDLTFASLSMNQN